jgi:hypothetical protein
LLRDAGSVKPWLAYIEFKQQNGTLYEQAFVRCLSKRSPFDNYTNLTVFADHGACLQTVAAIIQALEDGEPDLTHIFFGHEILTLIVPGIPHEALKGAQPYGISRRIPKGKCPLRKSFDPAQQDAAHLGNVPVLPPPTASRHPDSTNL